MPTLRTAGLAFGTALLLTIKSFAAPAQEPLSWPNRAPYVRVRVGYGVRYELMPTGAAQAAQQYLRQPPEHWGSDVATSLADWRLAPNSGLLGKRQHIVGLHDSEGGGRFVNFLVTRRAWSLLTDQSVTDLNAVMEHLGRELARGGLDDAQKLGDYLYGLDRLVVRGNRTLDAEFARYYSSRSNQTRWLEGREERAGVLRQLCHDPTVERRAGGEVTITCNVVRENGSVVRRTVHARLAGRRLELLRLEMVELLPAGTFSYPTILG